MKYIYTYEESKRIDIALSEFFSISRSTAQQYIHLGKVTLNGVIINKNSTLVVHSDILEIINDTEIKEESLHLVPEKIDFNILFEDEYLMVIDKPAGIIVHPGNGVSSGTIAHGMLFYLGGKTDMNDQRPGIVHRLDKDTSGVLLLAKNQSIHTQLSQLFEHRKVEKHYTCLVAGLLPKSGTIDSPITRHPHERNKMSISSHIHARNAITHFDVLEYSEKFSYIDCHIITGRTHQIRVHLSSIHHPIIGDTLYGNSSLNAFFYKEFALTRQFLHARSITFQHPITQKILTIEAPLPQELSEIKQNLFQ